MVSLRYYRPDADLWRVARSYYVLQANLRPDQTLHDILVPELANVRMLLQGQVQAAFADGRMIDLPSANLTIGPTSRPIKLIFKGPVKLFGIGVLPSGWRVLTATAADRLADQVIDTAQLIGVAAERALTLKLCAATTDQELVMAADSWLRDLQRDKGPCDMAVRIHTVLQDAYVATVDAMAHRLGISGRQLERHCLKSFGFAPKLLLRRQRILRALVALRRDPHASWLDIAGSEFYDQSHFIREFKYFTLRTPNEFIAAHRTLADAAHAGRTALAQMPAGQSVTVNERVPFLS